MFVYQNANREICITFQDNKPVEAPEYVITVDKEAGTLAVNGTVVNVASNDAPEASEPVEEPAVEEPLTPADETTTDGDEEEEE